MTVKLQSIGARSWRRVPNHGYTALETMRRASNYAPPVPFHSRPDMIDPTGEIAAWYTDPPGVIMQLMRPTHLSVERVKWLLGPGHRMLEERFPDAREFITVLDLRRMTSRDVAARTLLLDRSLARRELFHQSYVLLPESAGPIYRTSAQAGVTLLRVMGFPVEVTPSLDDAVRKASLRPAPQIESVVRAHPQR